MTNNIIEQAKKYVSELLIPLENHYYHQYNHALEVMDRAIYLWNKEWLSEEDIEILSLAALFHDTWFIIQYDHNEFIWAKIAQNFLKSMLYPKENIKKIEEIIMATDMNYKTPKNILEEIIKDADLDYLWMKEDVFYKNSTNLKKEIEAIKNIKILDPEWQHWTINFLKEHKYYTKTQREEREESKKQNQIELRKMIEEE